MRTTSPSATDDELVRGAIPLVHVIVGEIAGRLPGHVRRDELVSAGMLGLTQAAAAWDADRGVIFAGYARSRITGAVLDELRSRDWASRSVRRASRSHRLATNAFVAAQGRPPTPAELADVLGTGVDEVVRLQHDLARADVRSLETVADETNLPLLPDVPAEAVVAGELEEVLRSAVAALPERLRTVVVEYFFGERAMQSIADDLGVTESRVSQMRAEALALLRDGINAQLDPELVEDLGRTSGRVGRRKNRYYADVAARVRVAG